jgi:hypothetical protein
VLKHRYFYVTVSVLLLIAAIIVTTAVVSTKTTQTMETYSIRKYSAKKDVFSMWGAAGGESEEHVWYLRDLDNPIYAGGSDRDRVYLRMEGEGIHTILIKTNRDAKRSDNTISFTVLEFDMVRIMLDEKANNANYTTQTSRVIFNGRRRVLMEYLPEGVDQERVRFTLIKYMAKNGTWEVRNSIILTSPKVKILMQVYRKIHDKLESYEYRIGPSMILRRDHDDNDYEDINVDSDGDDISPPKSRRLDYVPQPMDSVEHPTASASLEEAMGVDEH